MKLLYLADRQALVRFGKPITGDQPVAMAHGPVLSRIYNFVSHKEKGLTQSIWEHFLPRTNSYLYTIKFASTPETSELSPAEVSLIDEIFSQFRGWDEWALVDYTHKLPEWRDPGVN